VPKLTVAEKTIEPATVATRKVTVKLPPVKQTTVKK
jgi:hypothetical protein